MAVLKHFAIDKKPVVCRFNIVGHLNSPIFDWHKVIYL